MKWGLANSYNDRIELNQHLKKHPLKRLILLHEKEHTNSDVMDVEHEFDIKVWKYWFPLVKFIIAHPSTWIDFSPFQIRKGRLVIDLNILILYTLIFILVIILKIIFF